jgi:dethiobiotin synthetase
MQSALSRIPIRLIFITGTDTGVGKTLLASLLLWHLRRAGCPALAIKPFCSGGRADAEILHRIQDADLTLDEINPFYFPEPLSPLVAARLHQRTISLRAVLEHIERVVERVRIIAATQRKIKNRTSKIQQPPTLIIEGSGGLLAPLGESPPVYAAVDLIEKLECEVIIVARNRLGTINHTLLTFQSIRSRAASSRIVLMNHRQQDSSSASNPAIMAELLAPSRVFLIPFLAGKPLESGHLKGAEKKIKKTLAQILG